MYRSYLTAPNGLNFNRSVGVPSSRLEKMRSYLRTVGKARKVDILRDVFGKVDVGRGWGTYLFGYGVRHGHFKKERIGNTVYWLLG